MTRKDAFKHIGVLLLGAVFGRAIKAEAQAPETATVTVKFGDLSEFTPEQQAQLRSIEGPVQRAYRSAMQAIRTKD